MLDNSLVPQAYEAGQRQALDDGGRIRANWLIEGWPPPYPVPPWLANHGGGPDFLASSVGDYVSGTTVFVSGGFSAI